MQNLLLQLEDTQQRTLKYFDLSESELQKTYAPGKWTVKQLLLHITDADTVLYDRIRRGISFPDQVIWAFRQDEWCLHLEYEKMPLALYRPIFDATRNAVIYFAKKYYESHGHHQYVHNETGLRTLKDEFDKIGWHCEHHLKQIERAIGKY